MNDLYCKDFEFLNKYNQVAYENLKQSILKRSRLDLEFLQKFIEFSNTALGTTQYLCAKSANVYAKDNKTMNYVTFCAEYLGLSDSTIKKLYLTYERFIVEFAGELDGQKSFSWAIPLFSDMSLTKIFELLTVSLDDLRAAYNNDELSANMTRSQIRDWVKKHNKGEDKCVNVKESIEKQEEPREEPKLKTYNKILDYIDFFKNTEETDPKQLKKMFVVDLHSLKNSLIEEFGLNADKDETLKLVND